MEGRMLPAMGSLGLEMSLHHQQQQQQQQQFPHTNQHLGSYPIQESQQSLKQSSFSYPNKAKQKQFSDEDEADEGGGIDGKKRIAQWQRMKWTDNMVRLLIMVVFYIGDDCNVEAANDSINGGGVKKKGSGVLQKKGKWKSVSRAMMEKGFYVSPQQCEDKFNDLNKRYKRVNDILGKGTACRVVENQSLLDTMDQLTPKTKDEVRKLLNSKHLFFKEMCAYHNSGGGGGCSNGGGYQSPDHQQKVNCFHSSENGGGVGANSRNVMELGMKNSKGGSREVVELDDEDEDDDDDEDDNEEEDETEGCSIGGRSHENNGEENEMVSSKRQRRQMFSSPQLKQMSCELVNVLQDGSKTPWEQRQWMMSRMMELEEQKVSYQCQAFELEKQRLKWIKFSAKKEREMERMKLNNERMRLENERMVLLLRKKEIELLHPIQQQSSNR
ncbi:hypothetical protein ACHQM5_020317 [Ranunculus cassubicifolius]